MIKKITLSVLAFLFMSLTVVQAQDDAEVRATDQEEATVEEEHNVFTPKPKNMWELGVQVGPSFISGDVTPMYPVPFSGFSAGLHVRKALGYAGSLRLEANYGSTSGIDNQLVLYATANRDLNMQELGYAPGDKFLRNYKTNFVDVSLQGIVNVGNLLFHKADNNWNFYLFGGLGILWHDTKINALDGSTPYDFSSIATGNSVKDKIETQKQFKDMRDGSYETAGVLGGTGRTGSSLYDSGQLLLNGQLGVGVSRKLSKRINLGLEHKVIMSGSDHLDGFRFRTADDKSNNNDLIHTTTIQLNFNLGSSEKRVEPLYWVNPLLAPYSDIAEVKARPVLDLTDSDGDGVPDMFDLEPNTPPGVAVDVKGRAIDSDGDGIPDYLDKEPFSPAGYEVDEDGVAIIDDPYLTESQVKSLISDADSKLEWFLPMIHFDLDKYFVKPEYIPQIKYVVDVLKMHPNVKVVVSGATDNRANDAYNKVLSYNRAKAVVDYMVDNFGVSRDRLILQYSGEDSPLVQGLKSSHNISKNEEYQHYMNRRVEFHVAGSGDTEMAAPDGPKAGSDTPGSSRPGSKYSGNRGSGY